MSGLAQLLKGTPVVAMDVGAARGLLPHWQPLEATAEIVMFEPDERAAAALRRKHPRALVLRDALSREGGERTLYIHATPTGSSLLPVRVPGALEHSDERHIFPVRQTTVQTRRLRDVLDDLKVPRVDLAKLDTQGTEVEILRGLDAERASKLLAVELEVGFPGSYDGQATIGDVSELMADLGLEPFDVVPKRYPLLEQGDSRHFERALGAYRNAPSLGHRVFELDVIYLRRRPLGPSLDDLRRLIVAYVVYGFFAHAYRLAGEAEGAERVRLRAVIAKLHRVSQRKRLAFDVAHRIVDKVAERLGVDG